MSHGVTWLMAGAGGEERGFFVWADTILIIRKRGLEVALEKEVYEFPTLESARDSVVTVTAALEGKGYLLVIEPTVIDRERREVEVLIAGDTLTLWDEMSVLVALAKRRRVS